MIISPNAEMRSHSCTVKSLTTATKQPKWGSNVGYRRQTANDPSAGTRQPRVGPVLPKLKKWKCSR
jgi:hypothetical protein